MLVAQATLTHIASLALFPSTEIVFTLKSTPREEKKKKSFSSSNILHTFGRGKKKKKNKLRKKSCRLTEVIREQGIEVTSS